MNVTPSRMVSALQTILQDTLGRLHTAASLTNMLNEAARNVHSLVREAQPNFFNVSTTIALVNGTGTYALPLDCPSNGIVRVERTNGGITFQMAHVKMQERIEHTGGDMVFSVYHDGRRLQMVFSPTPTSAENITVWYQRAAIPMQYGTPASMTASTIQLAATPTGGQTYLETNACVGARVHMTAGSALGNVLQISAYNVVTRVATVASTWAATTTTGATYEILPGWIDDQFSDAIVYDAASEAFERDEEDGENWRNKRDQRIQSLLKQVGRLQRVHPMRMELDRSQDRSGRRAVARDYYNPYRR